VRARPVKRNEIWYFLVKIKVSGAGTRPGVILDFVKGDFEFWERRYSEPAYAYGTEPNAFLVEVADRIPPGPILCLAEGEGRNAAWLAGRGHAVTAVDASAAGLAKAAGLARERGVLLETVAADLADFRIKPGAWSGIVAIFAHLPPALRRTVHRTAAGGLVPGGAFVLEAFTPRQLAFGTGGPQKEELLYTLEMLREDLAGLNLEIGREVEREVVEGIYHTGPAAVVQVFARR
jgi:SAM-dependent methyltransferase